MGQAPQHLPADVLTLNRALLRRMRSLLTGHGCLKQYMHRIGIFKNERVCRLRNEEYETAYHVVLLGPTNLLTDLPKKDDGKTLPIPTVQSNQTKKEF